ncbi:ComEC/Rec2 family competence protein, partial [Patescibacteria group bacterium]|nr:ComEC/Rec2 family competence protein [Patescibacteria group bacterium]
IIAVSGYNITVLISIVSSIFLVLGRKLCTWFTLLFIFLFVIFVGLSNIPVIRAGIMGAIYVLNREFGRKSVIYTMLSFTAALLIFENPLVFTQISFLLSFCSTIGLVSLNNKVSGLIKWVPEFLREDLASTLSALLTTLPITVFNFSKFSLISPISNLLVLPVVPLITVYGMVYVLTLHTFPFLEGVFRPLLWLLLEYVIQVINRLSCFKYSNIDLFGPAGTLLSLLLVGIYVVVLISFFKKRE